MPPVVDPAYDLIHASIVACQTNLLAPLQGTTPAETSGDDNLCTCRLYFGAYDSAAQAAVLKFE